MRAIVKPTGKTTVTLLSALLGMAVVGCASTGGESSGAGAGSEAAAIAAQRAELEAQEAELARREAVLAQQLARLQAEAGTEAETGSADNNNQQQAAPFQASEGALGGSLMPTGPKPGECYAQVIVPPKFRAKAFSVVRSEASSRLETVPARYEKVSKRVLVKPESSVIEVIPAQYEEVEEEVLVKPATRKIEVVPAVYETIETEVVVKPAHTEWKRVTDIDADAGNAFASAGPTIERFGDYKVLDTRVEDAGLMCLVEIPATTKKISKRVVRTPATTREIVVPAEYRTVRVVREISPASTRVRTIPAEYRIVEATELVAEETTRSVDIPADMATETAQEKISDTRIEWRPVLCKVNMTRENVSALQNALTATGQCRCGASRKVCPADGLMGPCTLNAVKRFAQEKGMAYGTNYVTIDVIRELGLQF